MCLPLQPRTGHPDREHHSATVWVVVGPPGAHGREGAGCLRCWPCLLLPLWTWVGSSVSGPCATGIALELWALGCATPRQIFSPQASAPLGALRMRSHALDLSPLRSQDPSPALLPCPLTLEQGGHPAGIPHPTPTRSGAQGERTRFCSPAMYQLYDPRQLCPLLQAPGSSTGKCG